MKNSKDFASFSELYPDVVAQLPPGMKLQVSKYTFAQIAEMKQSSQKVNRAKTLLVRRVAGARMIPAIATMKTVRDKKKSDDLCPATA